MPKICVDARLIEAPGIGTYLKNLFFHFRHTSFEWYALVHSNISTEISSWDFMQPIFFSSPIYSAREQVEFSIKIPRVDLFWSPHYNVPLLPIRARKRLVTIHDAFHLAHKKRLSIAKRAYAQRMLRAALKGSARTITPSHFSKNEIYRHTGMENCPVHVIPHGVDTERFSPHGDAAKIKHILKKYAIERPFLLYVGSLKAHKNVKGLVDAFCLLENKLFDLVIIGKGGPEEMAALQRSESVHYLGYVPEEELPYFYRAAHLFIFLSLYEGFGLPPLEAMSSGCPTLVSTAGALPEVCGDGVFYIDPKTAYHVAKQLDALLKEKEKLREIARRGLERSSHFCWKESASRHLALMGNLIA